MDEIIKEVKNSLNPGGLIGSDGRRGDLRGFFLERYGKFWDSLKKGDMVGAVKYGVEIIAGGITVGSWVMSGFKEIVKALLEKEASGG
ncbi:hypothetical protein [Methanothermobacter tenebrarum]|uniref:hypothetical protein n=1 Tax=Methanothermobacter tenebrarum TaxID=680118 RepID=UPI0011BD0934|nr:hypothetical protein [Methanothermobacter tenebrarum]NPV64745.1 hypothetical protein [Methanobacteriaceae archaeon]